MWAGARGPVFGVVSGHASPSDKPKPWSKTSIYVTSGYHWVTFGYYSVVPGHHWRIICAQCCILSTHCHYWASMGHYWAFIAIALSEGVLNPPFRTPPPTTAHALRQCKPNNSEHRNAMVCVCVNALREMQQRNRQIRAAVPRRTDVTQSLRLRWISAFQTTRKPSFEGGLGGRALNPKRE